MIQRSLTKRQVEFLAKSAQGMTSEQIAKSCYVTANTVRSTFTEARKRLGATTTVQCVIMAIAREELGLDHEGYCYIPDFEN